MTGFGINTAVEMALSGERGIIIGVAEFAESPMQYYVRFVAADGRQCEGWFNREALTLSRHLRAQDSDAKIDPHPHTIIEPAIQ